MQRPQAVRAAPMHIALGLRMSSMIKARLNFACHGRANRSLPTGSSIAGSFKYFQDHKAMRNVVARALARLVRVQVILNLLHFRPVLLYMIIYTA